MLTALAGAEHTMGALAAGAHDYLADRDIHPDDQLAATIAVYEAAANVVDHAYCEAAQ